MHSFVGHTSVRRLFYPLPSIRLFSANRRVSTSTLRTVSCIISTIDKLPVDAFRREAFVPQEARLITISSDPGVNTAAHCSTPAARKWFVLNPDGGQTLNVPYLEQFKDIILPYELVGHHSERSI